MKRVWEAPPPPDVRQDVVGFISDLVQLSSDIRIQRVAGTQFDQQGSAQLALQYLRAAESELREWLVLADSMRRSK